MVNSEIEELWLKDYADAIQARDIANVYDLQFSAVRMLGPERANELSVFVEQHLNTEEANWLLEGFVGINDGQQQ